MSSRVLWSCTIFAKSCRCLLKGLSFFKPIPRSILSAPQFVRVFFPYRQIISWDWGYSKKKLEIHFKEKKKEFLFVQFFFFDLLSALCFAFRIIVQHLCFAGAFELPLGWRNVSVETWCVFETVTSDVQEKYRSPTTHTYSVPVLWRATAVWWCHQRTGEWRARGCHPFEPIFSGTEVGWRLSWGTGNVRFDVLWLDRKFVEYCGKKKCVCLVLDSV